VAPGAIGIGTDRFYNFAFPLADAAATYHRLHAPTRRGSNVRAIFDVVFHRPFHDA
jgi:hypothetical protein